MSAISHISAITLLLLACGKSIATDTPATETTVIPSPASANLSPDPASIEACKPLLLQAPQATERIAQIRKIFNDNLHWGGDRHTFFPSRRASWNDMQIAHSHMTANDIPILVYLIGAGRVERGVKSIAIGVLVQFEIQALPCIQSGIEVYRMQRASDLMAIENLIKVNASQQ